MSPRHRFLRRLSTILLLSWVAVLAASLVHRQIGRHPSLEPVDLGAEVERGDEQPVRVHRGFVYTDTIGTEPNFRVAARETVQFATGWYELRDTEVWLYHRGEVVYGLTAPRARFNPARREAEATGDVQLALQGGVVVRASGFSLRGPERLLESHGAASFAGEGFGGVAGGVRCSLVENTIELYGGVSTAWRENPEESPSLVLLAPALTYRRERAILSFPEGVTLLQGGIRMRAGPSELQLEAEERGLRRAELGGPVEIEGELGQGATVEALAGGASVEMAENQESYRLSFSPAADLGWVRLRWRDPLVGWRELDAWRLVGEIAQGTWAWLEGQGLACGTELRPRSDPLRVEAEQFRLDFTDGRPATARAENDVRLFVGDQWARGDRLSLSIGTKSYALTAAPKQWVTVGTSEVECQAGKLESGTDQSEVVARGGVTGRLRRGTLWGGEEGPIRFAASSMRVLDRGQRMILEGDARLWQGDRVVRADYLEYEREDEVVTARGNVVTVAPPAEGVTPGERAEIRARYLKYLRLGNTATYEGDVVLTEPRSRVTCQRLVINLAPDGKLLLATLDGGVTVHETAADRTLKGQNARLDAARDLMELWGNPVLVQEPGGNQIKGDHLQWRRAVGTVTVVGGENAPSETLYRPMAPQPTPSTSRRP